MGNPPLILDEIVLFCCLHFILIFSFVCTRIKFQKYLGISRSSTQPCIYDDMKSPHCMGWEICAPGTGYKGCTERKGRLEGAERQVDGKAEYGKHSLMMCIMICTKLVLFFLTTVASVKFKRDQHPRLWQVKFHGMIAYEPLYID